MIALDTLKYCKKMMKAGFTAKQAEAQAEALSEFVDEQMATKRDLSEFELRMDTRFSVLENRLMIKFGGMITIATAVLMFFISIHHS